MIKRLVLWPMMMGLAIYLSGCAAQIADGPLCSPLPVGPGQCRGSSGVACDMFLTKNPQDLNASQWEEQQELWESQGCVMMETTSCFVSQLKAEIEKLCTMATCTEAQQAQVQQLKANYDRIMNVASRAKRHHIE